MEWQAICWGTGLDHGLRLSDTQTLNYPHAHFICPYMPISAIYYAMHIPRSLYMPIYTHCIFPCLMPCTSNAHYICQYLPSTMQCTSHAHFICPYIPTSYTYACHLQYHARQSIYAPTCPSTVQCTSRAHYACLLCQYMPILCAVQYVCPYMSMFMCT